MPSDPTDPHVPYRRIRDTDHRSWDIWEIGPDSVLGAGSYDRRHTARDANAPDFMLSGWLCFESNGDRRRFAPIPYGWEFLSDELLRFLLGISEEVKRTETAEPSREPTE